jgi:cysteine desulfurase family protein (TIGR01976 family)
MSGEPSVPAASPPVIEPDRIRSWFPGLATPTALLENAGGSQVPGVVADAIRDYMLTSYVQLEAGYDLSDRADRVVADAHDFVELFMNGRGTGRVALGPSTSQLVTMLAQASAARMEPGDEIVVCEAGHEANVGPWMKLADRGITVRMWRVDPATMTCPLDGLRELLGPRTRIVAFVHVSNLLGEIVDVPAVTRLAHEAGARVVVDGVAFAPHRAMDVAAWDVDWYVYSTYKVYGPHMAALWGRHDALAEVAGPNHFFVPDDEIPYKLELGGVNHEGCAGLLALRPYLAFLAGRAGADAIDRAAIVDAFETMTAAERPLQERLVEYLAGAPGVRIIGPAHGGLSRVGTISFVHEGRSSAEIVAAVQARGVGIRHGHMYAHRLCTALGIEPEDGVVRVSFVHYNTMDEIERLIGALERIL